jgi:hypothetical protein
VSGTLFEGCNTILPQEIPSLGVLLMVVENAVSGVAPESSINVQLGLMLIKLFSDHSCPVNGGLITINAMGAKYNNLPSIFTHDPKYDGMLIA